MVVEVENSSRNSPPGPTAAGFRIQSAGTRYFPSTAASRWPSMITT